MYGGTLSRVDMTCLYPSRHTVACKLANWLGGSTGYTPKGIYYTPVWWYSYIVITWWTPCTLSEPIFVGRQPCTLIAFSASQVYYINRQNRQLLTVTQALLKLIPLGQFSVCIKTLWRPFTISHSPVANVFGFPEVWEMHMWKYVAGIHRVMINISYIPPPSGATWTRQCIATPRWFNHPLPKKMCSPQMQNCCLPCCKCMYGHSIQA